MRIEVVSATGVGPTKLAAFDAALTTAGIADRNLICLSSIIPPESEVAATRGRLLDTPGSWGDRLYVVLADQREHRAGVEAWAGIGWVQDETGRGLFVEHYGQAKAQLEHDITATLRALMHTRNMNGLTIQMELIGAACDEAPVCALVAAVYQAEAWAPHRRAHKRPKFTETSPGARSVTTLGRTA
jgi:arginine decarboxylase